MQMHQDLKNDQHIFIFRFNIFHLDKMAELTQGFYHLLSRRFAFDEQFMDAMNLEDAA